MKKLPLVLAGIFAIGATGCDSLKAAKSFFQGEALSSNRLELTITPDKGIKIFIDGQLKGKSSPYNDTTISYGSHTLKITAPGYYPLEMPFEVKEGQQLRFPLSLRVMPSTEKGTEVVTNASSANSKKIKSGTVKQQAANASADSEAPADSVPAPAQELVIEDRSPVTVRVGLDPEGQLFLDGHKIGRGSSIQVTFNQSLGRLKIRHDDDTFLEFSYQLNNDGRLEIRPKDNCRNIMRNGAAAASDRYYFIGLQPQRFEAVCGPEQVKQAVIFKMLTD